MWCPIPVRTEGTKFCSSSQTESQKFDRMFDPNWVQKWVFATKIVYLYLWVFFASDQFSTLPPEPHAKLQPLLVGRFIRNILLRLNLAIGIAGASIWQPSLGISLSTTGRILETYMGRPREVDLWSLLLALQADVTNLLILRWLQICFIGYADRTTSKMVVQIPKRTALVKNRPYIQ